MTWIELDWIWFEVSNQVHYLPNLHTFCGTKYAWSNPSIDFSSSEINFQKFSALLCGEWWLVYSGTSTKASLLTKKGFFWVLDMQSLLLEDFLQEKCYYSHAMLQDHKVKNSLTKKMFLQRTTLKWRLLLVISAPKKLCFWLLLRYFIFLMSNLSFCQRREAMVNSFLIRLQFFLLISTSMIQSFETNWL